MQMKGRNLGKGNMKKKNRILWGGALIMIGIIAAAGIFFSRNDSQENPKDTGWQIYWNDVKDDWTQISLLPGSDESKLNFAWYTPEDTTDEESDPDMEALAEKTDPEAAEEKVPSLLIGEGKDMKKAKLYPAVQAPAEGVKDSRGETYHYNYVTVSGLKENTVYYYSYDNGKGYTEPAEYRTKGTEEFSFIFAGDPQIGSSSQVEDTGSDAFAKAQEEAVSRDAEGWNQTIQSALEQTKGDAAFMISAGDQIQTPQSQCPDRDVSYNEMEYTGYLSPQALRSLPAAVSVGNHDGDNTNFSYHFHMPNQSSLGKTAAAGDYYFTYGKALFLMINAQSDDMEEHRQFIEETVSRNEDCRWRIVILHQDIYGSALHSNEPEILTLREQMTPILEENDIDLVLSGHDHAYSRSRMLKEGKESEQGTETEQRIIYQNPAGILYLTGGSSSGSKYYDLTEKQQSYIAARWQENAPTYSIIKISGNSLTINTYRTDHGGKIDQEVVIEKE